LPTSPKLVGPASELIKNYANGHKDLGLVDTVNAAYLLGGSGGLRVTFHDDQRGRFTARDAEGNTILLLDLTAWMAGAKEPDRR
jgi:hypothetical protein